MNIKLLHTRFLQCNAISTDTRKVLKNDMFFALRGGNFNGNTFAEKALFNGAKYAIIDEKKFESENTILVDDALKTLQELATFHRKHINIPIIALTGSNGKTTTKELINAVLSKKYNTIATIGNLNNHIGVPLTLLSMSKETEIGIVEMGANHLKEIEFLCNITQPDFGYITNFGKAHLEGFGSIDGVIEAKSELYSYLTNNNKYVFFNVDDSIQKEKLSTYIKKIGFSQNDLGFYNIKFLEANPFIKLKTKDITINSNLIGEYNFTNICAALLIGTYFNIKPNDLKTAIENYTPTNNRSQIIEKNTNKIILDAYNANPSSMEVALQNFAKQTGPSKIAILGDMFELGEETEKEHQNIVNMASKISLDNIILIGENFFKTDKSNPKIKAYSSFEDFNTSYKLSEIKNTTILIKGSRGMALERILDLL